jgi:hypothetical protein
MATANMNVDPHLQDEIYRVVGEEVARREFHPGPMARAVSGAGGDPALVQSLYIKFRFEELVRQIERRIAPEELQRAVDEEQQRLTEVQQGVLKCPNCGHRGQPIQKARGNWIVLIVLFCLWIVPGLIYLLAYHGFKKVCSKCGKTLVELV